MPRDSESQAPFCPEPEGAHEYIRAPIYYGNQHVPKPNNRKAMEVDAARIMREVMDA
jgi:hypothetical protein